MKKFLSVNTSFFVLAAVLAVVVIVFNLPPQPPSAASDSSWYLAIAQGHISEVIKPFSGRFLHPFLAGWLQAHFSLNLENSFLLIAEISLVLFLVLVSLILKKALPSPLLLIPLFLLPYFVSTFSRIYSPDLFYNFLIALFFLFLFYKREDMGLVVLFLLFLSRESTIFLGLVLLIVTFIRERKFLFVTTLVVVALSVFTSGQINNLGLPNTHGLNDFVYLIIRLPYYVLHNFLGIRPWVNTLAQNCQPVFELALPQWSFLGHVSRVGICGFDISLPLRTLTGLLTALGVLPLLLFYLLRYKLKAIWEKAPTWLVVALLYGVGSYFIGTLVTTGVERWSGYGWPAFSLAVPFLVQMFFKVDRPFIIKLSLANMVVAWFAFVVGMNGITVSSSVLAILVALGAYGYTFRTLKRQPMRQSTAD